MWLQVSRGELQHLKVFGFFFSFSFLSFQHMVVLLKVYFHDSSCFLFFLSSFLLSLAPVLLVLFPYWEAFI